MGRRKLADLCLGVPQAYLQMRVVVLAENLGRGNLERHRRALPRIPLTPFEVTFGGKAVAIRRGENLAGIIQQGSKNDLGAEAAVLILCIFVVGPGAMVIGDAHSRAISPDTVAIAVDRDSERPADGQFRREYDIRTHHIVADVDITDRIMEQDLRVLLLYDRGAHREQQTEEGDGHGGSLRVISEVRNGEAR